MPSGFTLKKKNKMACPTGSYLSYGLCLDNVTQQIVGDEKLGDLRQLSSRVKLSVVADSTEVVEGLSRAFASNGQKLTVLVECNTGADRCGVLSPEAAAMLASQISNSSGLQFGGLMTYLPIGASSHVQAFMAKAKGLIQEKGYAVSVVTSGGTPDMMSAHLVKETTEYWNHDFSSSWHVSYELRQNGSCGSPASVAWASGTENCRRLYHAYNYVGKY